MFLWGLVDIARALIFWGLYKGHKVKLLSRVLKEKKDHILKLHLNSNEPSKSFLAAKPGGTFRKLMSSEIKLGSI